MNLFTEYKKFPKGSGIYKITTQHNKLFYIGSALSLSKRMKDHRNSLIKNKSHCYYLQNVYNKHGKEDFTVEFLFIDENLYKLNSNKHRELLALEENFIKILNPKYNTILTPTTQVNNPATSKKVYQYTITGEFVKEWNSGREVLRVLGIQIQNGLKNKSSGGFQWSYKKLNRISSYEENRGVKKELEVYDLLGNKLNSFSSIKECVKYYNDDHQRISYALKTGRNYNNKKFVFKNAS